jgi:hypothetical protein
MHRVILERKLDKSLKNAEEADHINGNRLDNRRTNLRLTTHLENSSNIKKPRRIKTDKISASNYKGVSYNKCNGKWRARITFKGNTTHIGYYDNEKDAAIEYDKKAIILFGEYAKLNFHNERYAWEIHKENGCAYEIEV